MKKLVIAIALLAAGCGDSSTPSSPTSTSPGVSLNGTYSGLGSDSSGPGRMTWIISQSGTSVSGTMTGATPGGTVQFRGNISGTLSGTTLTFTISVPPGGVSASRSCTITITGSATGVTNSTINGTYSGTSTCTAPFTNGQFTLTKP